MRAAFLHEAVITVEPRGDPGAPGAAITVALCGAWDHPLPCPLAPHQTEVLHTEAGAHGERSMLRILFAAEPADEPEVRRLIEKALQHGQLTCPDATTTCRQLHESGGGTLTAADTEHADRLLQS